MSPPFDLNSTFGAYLIGTFISAIFYGVTCFQAFQYFNSYSDGPLIWGTVFLLWVLESIHAGFSFHAIYYFIVENYLNPPALLRSDWSATVNLGILGIIILIVHLSYARRIYILNGKKKLLPMIVVFGALVHTGFWWALVGSALQVVDFRNFHGTVDNLGKVSLSLSATVDIVIAVTLSYLLHKSRTSIASTNDLINRLLIYTINNGTLTSIGDILILAFLIAEQNTFLYLAVTQVVGNLYTNALLATLNGRRRLGKATLNVDGTSLTVSLPQFAQTVSTASSVPRTRTTTSSGFGTKSTRADKVGRVEAEVDVIPMTVVDISSSPNSKPCENSATEGIQNEDSEREGSSSRGTRMTVL